MSARVSYPRTQIPSKMRTAIERNDPGTVNRFGHDDHVPGTLDDLQVGIVDRRQQRRDIGTPREAALEIRSVLRSVVRIAPSRGAIGRPLPRLRRQGRDAPITWVDDQRR